jgi:hypothetical protein
VDCYVAATIGVLLSTMKLLLFCDNNEPRGVDDRLSVERVAVYSG